MGKKRTRKGSDKNDEKRAITSTLILVLAIAVFLFSGYKLAMMLIPYYVGGDEYNKVKDLALTEEKNAESGETEFTVNFDELLAANADTIAWIRFDEPSIISYPVVKSKDNTEYLTRTFQANDNKLGAIFMDMDNQSDFSDKNTFIYGHNLKVGGEMFSELMKYEEEEFYKKNPYFYIYTPDKKIRKYQIFSAGVVKDVADNYNKTYDTDEAFQTYIELAKSSSGYVTDVPVDISSKIVSLSTCTNIYDEDRFLVQGVLVEEE